MKRDRKHPAAEHICPQREVGGHRAPPTAIRPRFNYGSTHTDTAALFKGFKVSKHTKKVEEIPISYTLIWKIMPIA